MKKILLILLILTTFLFVTSCDKKEADNNESSSSLNEDTSSEETSTTTENAPSDKPNLSAHELMKLYDTVLTEREDRYSYAIYEDDKILFSDLIKNDGNDPINFAHYKVIKTPEELNSLELSVEVNEHWFDENYILIIQRTHGEDHSDEGIGYRNLTLVNNEPIIVLETYFRELRGQQAYSTMVDYVLIPKEEMPQMEVEGEILIFEIPIRAVY